MLQTIRSLKPERLWNHFSDLNEVPRPSKREDRVTAFMKNFGENLGLSTHVDHIGNVLIQKPATQGMGHKTPIILQSHLDMVHQKNANVNFDFETEGIKMKIDGDWVKAEGTTLGADNGIGVATIMAILESKNIIHPAIDALFTIDEETGMTGAKELKGGLLKGKILLNLDTEDDDELTIGCAGGVDVTGKGTYTQIFLHGEHQCFKLSVTGLTGGHSGMEIHKGLGNANKIMNRVLNDLNHEIDIKVNSIDGGGLRNAIPRESFCLLAIPTDQVKTFKNIVSSLRTIFKIEYNTTDPNLDIQPIQIEKFDSIIAPEDLDKIINVIYSCPSGIYRMSRDIPGLVQTSNNLARVLVKNSTFELMCLTRSAIDSEKKDLSNVIRAVFALIGASVTFKGEYPGWTPKPGAKIVKIMEDIYTLKFNSTIKVAACHAGLECGIIGTNYPEMEMVSFGPNIRGAHSPDEKVQISSVQKFWDYLLEVLKQIPDLSEVK